ncbi:Hypothetical predicted protein [Olea europaea subsp. europaea]|uniref:Uncharacterized protein n=1 Tax=Olea europaea subsp. europaea TaxID=158383 RepID=A0A8S0V193_OLEEU|nr:Hypothetical predicted protein [Olea europaea subsp. europaea]
MMETQTPNIAKWVLSCFNASALFGFLMNFLGNIFTVEVEAASTSLMCFKQSEKRVGRKKFHDTRHPIYREAKQTNLACKLLVPAFTGAKDIQKATSEAAKAFGQLNFEPNEREEAPNGNTNLQQYVNVEQVGFY